jgi:Ca-activated chloride channel homolog
MFASRLTSSPRPVTRALVLSIVLAFAPHARAVAGPEVQADPRAERTLSPYFFVPGGDDGVDRLPLLSTDVRVEIAGVIAHVTVRQAYKNDGTEPLHAKYVFPASTRAAVHGLTMTVGDHVVRAQIREKEKAKREFQAARAAGKRAALLEQERPNVFTMQLANVMPGQRIDVELEYSELLESNAGVYEFVYPTVVGPRYSSTPIAGPVAALGGDATLAAAAPPPPSDHWIASPYLHEDEEPTSTLSLRGTLAAGVPVRDLASSSHTIQVKWADPTRVEFGLGAGEERGGNRDFILRYRLTGDALQSGLLLHEGADENFFLLMVQPPQRVAAEQVPPREYLFVLDVSGSMAGYPLETAKHLMRDLVGQLRPIDSFNVVTFAGNSAVWAPRSLPATPENVRAAIAGFEQLQGGGGTELLAAIRRAMALPRGEGSRSIVLVTDGYIEAEAGVFDYIRGHLDQANVFAFGIGTGVNRYLIEGVARAGMGEPFVVTEAAQAREAAARFRQYVQYPLLTGVKVAFGDLEAYDVTPASLPDVLADRPIVLQGKYRGKANGQVVVTGVAGTGRWQHAIDVAGVKPQATNHALRELWARTRVGEIADWTGREPNDAERAEIVALGLRYDLLTRYTSFVAVHEQVVNPGGAGHAVSQPLPLPKGVSDLAVGGHGAPVGVGMGDEPGLAWLMAGMLVAATLLVLRSRIVPAPSRS